MNASKPLAGYRVLECGHLIAGPFAGTILSYFGAEVIKIEPKEGDQLRDYRVLHDETKTSLWWYSIGRNKRTLSLDLKNPKAQEIVRELCDKSDVLIENFKPGRMEKWNLGPSDVSDDLIYARVSGYGQTGPYSNKPGFASVCEAMGGFRYINGFENGPSVRPNLSLGDTLAGVHAAIGILVALLGRDGSKSPQSSGQVVDVAIYEAVFNIMEAVLPEYDHKNTVREPSGSTITGIVPSNTYKCKDGKYVVIGANTDTLFVKLMTKIGSNQVGEDERFNNNAKRVIHQAYIDEIISKWTLELTAAQVVAELDKAGIPVGNIMSIQDICQNEQYQSRSMFESVSIRDSKHELKLPALCPKLSKTPGSTEWAGRDIGQDTHKVLSEILGKSDAEIQQLLRSQVVYQSSQVTAK